MSIEAQIERLQGIVNNQWKKKYFDKEFMSTIKLPPFADKVALSGGRADCDCLFYSYQDNTFHLIARDGKDGYTIHPNGNMIAYGNHYMGWYKWKLGDEDWLDVYGGYKPTKSNIVLFDGYNYPYSILYTDTVAEYVNVAGLHILKGDKMRNVFDEQGNYIFDEGVKGNAE